MTQTEVVDQDIFYAERELDGLLEMEEIWWSQRSRASRLQHGGKNTKFFHRKASQRKAQNTIYKIQDDASREVAHEVDIAGVVVDYFRGLFTSSGPTRVG